MRKIRKDNGYWKSFNESLLPIGLFDFKKTLIECNNAFEKKIFYKNGKEDYLGKDLEEVFQLQGNKILQDLFNANFNNLKQGKIAEPIKFHVYSRNNSQYIVNWFAHTIFIENEMYVQGILSDLTPQKKEQEIKNNIKLLVNKMKEGLVITNKNAKITNVNKRICELLGYSEKELLGRPIYDVIANSSRSITEGQIDIHRKSKDDIYDVELKKKDGSIVTVSVNASALQDSVGNVLGSFTIFNDISRLKEFDKELNEYKAQLKIIVERGSFAFFTHDLEGNILSVNEMAMQFTGYSKKELLKMNINELEVSDISLIDKQRYWRILPIGNNVIVTSNHKRKNGTIFPIEINLVKIISNEKEIIATLVYDTSIQTNAEIQLKEDSKKLSILNQIIIIGNQAKNLKIYLELVLNTCLKLMNFSAGGVYLKYESKDFAELVSHKGLSSDFIKKVKKRKIFEEPYKSIFIYGKALFSNDYRNVNPEMVDKSGILSLASIPLTSGSKILGALNIASKQKKKFSTFEKDLFQSIGREIGTAIERISSEEKLKQSEEKYRSLFESSPNGLMLVNMKGIIIDCNSPVEAISGYTKEDLIGQNFMQLGVIPDEFQKMVGDSFLELLKGNPAKATEVQFLTKDKKKKWIRLQANLVEIAGERVIQVISEFIHEKKIAEEKLKESEERYRSLFESSPNAIVLMDMDGTILDLNPAMEMLNQGTKNEDYIGRDFFEFTYIPGEYQAIVQKDFKSLLMGSPVGPREIPYYTEQDKVDWIRYQCSIVKIGNKDIIQAIIQYITDKKLAEQKIMESEEKFRTIAEHSIMGNTIMQEGNIVYVNQRLADIMGYNAEEMIGWTNEDILKTIHPDDVPMIAKNLKERDLGTNKSTNHYQFRGIRKNGDVIYEELYSKPIIYEGKITNFISIMDVTDVKKAESLVKESEEKYRLIAENANDLILIVNKDFQIEYINEYAHKKILGYTKHDFLTNINTPEWIHPDDMDKGREFISVLEKAEDLTTDLRFKHKNGNYVWLEIKVNSYIDKNGEIKILLLSRDISEHKNIEKKLKELNQIKTELIRRTSHELKTPLIAIKGFTDLLLSLHQKKLIPPLLSIVTEIKKGCTRLEKIVVDLLESSKLESGLVKLKKSPEDLSFLIKYTLDEISFLAQNRRHEIFVELSEDTICNIEKEKIHDVILNLLINAIKNTPPQGTIKIKSQVKETEILVSIKDNGIGITPEEMKRLFTQFGKIERYGQGMDLGIEGTGLGLYLSKKIIELHGGRIWAESEGRNKGATFFFTIPIDIN
ncbi:MAG: PAS domain S-box protein [Promethearchaeota archaeon]